MKQVNVKQLKSCRLHLFHPEQGIQGSLHNHPGCSGLILILSHCFLHVKEKHRPAVIMPWLCVNTLIFRSGSLRTHCNFLLCWVLWKAVHIFFMGWVEESGVLCVTVTLLLSNSSLPFTLLFLLCKGHGTFQNIDTF